MRSMFTNATRPTADLRQLGIGIGLLLLFFIANLNHDPQSGWTFRNYPLDRPVLEVTKEQALSLIQEHQIQAYGIRRGQLVLLSKTGKWFSLRYFENQELVRPLGATASYIAYYESYRSLF